MRKLSYSKYLVTSYEDFKFAMDDFANYLKSQFPEEVGVYPINTDDPEYTSERGQPTVVIFDSYKTPMERYVTANFVVPEDFGITIY